MKLVEAINAEAARSALQGAQNEAAKAEEAHAKAFRKLIVDLCNENDFCIEAENGPHEDLIIRRAARHGAMNEENVSIDLD